LIIEVKRWDRGMQDDQQWEKELIAYTNEYGAQKRQVKMIALGGIHSHKDQTIKYVWRPNDADGENPHDFICPVHMCQWSTVLLECQRMKRALERSNRNNPSSQTFADLRILTDLTAFFTTHGYVALRWFEDFDFKSNLLDDSADSDQQYFHNIRFRFQSL
jgi:hypothetical protein